MNARVGTTRWPVAALATAWLVAACGGRADPRGVDSLAGAAQVSPVESPVLLRLERGPCRGSCPEYAVSLRADGSVQYTGVRHVAVTGEQRDTVDAAAVVRLHEALMGAGIATVDTLYGIDSPRCGQYLPDTPVSTLAARLNGALRRVHYEPGCTGAPAFLATFASRIDSLANTSTWVRTPEETP